MRIFQLKTIQNDILYGGNFPSYVECLEHAVAQKANLNGIDLRNLNLSNIMLDEARMEGASFRGSNLTGANLSEACLKGSDFSGSALYNACLCESDLTECNFEDASFGATDITASLLNACRFSTVSSLLLDFTQVGTMQGCTFKNPCGQISAMSRPPIVIQGILPLPIAFFDHQVKIGASLKPHEEWFSLIGARYLQDRNLKLAG